MNYLDIKPEVKSALEADKPVVALESTIIAHGMPYPENIETALEVEEIVRNQGAVPATVAILDGQLKIGLTEEEIKLLGQSEEVIKVSRRDMPVVAARGQHGATTVAGTMIAAELAGIEVFVTGGIGGVHRGADETFDISADLYELSRTNVAVVSAGPKAILDIGLTLEQLETLGVPVLGYQTEELPAFYTRRSGYQADYKVEDAQEAAEIITTKWNLGLEGGLLISNPIPQEDEIEPEVIKQAIETALEEAKVQNIEGKELTPFLLDRIKEITEGDSLTTNIALVKDNARTGAEIAEQLKKPIDN